jgi:hypothetical protein
MDRDYISHHGIKGMKWGVRRSKEVLDRLAGRLRAAKEKMNSPKDKPTRKRVSEMSDAELKNRLNRLEMERKYNQYMAELHPKKQSRAKKLIGDILENGARTIASKTFEKIAKSVFEKEKKDPKTILDPAKLDSYSDKEIEAANKRMTQINMLLKNMETLGTSGDAYEAKVKAGKGYVQEALEKMENKSYDYDDKWWNTKR